MSTRRTVRWGAAWLVLALVVAACSETPTTSRRTKKASPTPTLGSNLASASASPAPASDTSGGAGGNNGGTNGGGSGATQAPAAKTGSLAIALDQGLRVQAIDAIVAKVSFKLTGPNLVAPITKDVAQAAFTGGKATAFFPGLTPGPVTIDVDVFDAGDRLIGRGQKGPVEVAADEAKSVDVLFNYASGSVTVTLDGPVAPTPAISIGSGS